jgi:hypothetical protein
MLERTAELLTDGIRSLLLERSGYATKLFEFVSVEHTPKNNMLVGTLGTKAVDPVKFDQQVEQLLDAFGIKHQRLRDLLEA